MQKNILHFNLKGKRRMNDKPNGLRPVTEVPFDARPRAKEETSAGYPSPITPASLLETDFYPDSMADAISAMDYGEVRDIGQAMFEIMTRPMTKNLDTPDKVSNLIFTWAKEHNLKRSQETTNGLGIPYVDR
jgi:hypothetical protein